MANQIKIQDANYLLQSGRIVSSYRGKPGCGCGCRGTYSESKATHKRRLAAASEVEMDVDCRIDIQQVTGEESYDTIVSYETNDTYIWFYLDTSLSDLSTNRVGGGDV